MKALVQAITALVVPAAMFAQGGAEIVHLPDYLPVRDLVASQRVRTQVVEKRMLEDRTEFTVVMTDDKGRTIGGYAAPYLQAGQDAAQLWREYVTTYLATPTTDDRLKVREERRAGDEKFAVAFVLDHSPSMTMPRAIRMQRAVQQALTNFEQDDFVSIVKFTSRVKTEVPLTSKKESYLEEFKVNGINVRNDGTAIYDATREGLEQLAEAPSGVHKILIVFTDGEDNSSSATLNQVKDEAKSQGATVYAVTYGVADDQPLVDLAEATGGRVHRLHDVHDFEGVFLGIYSGLRHSYIVSVDHKNSSRGVDLFTGAIEPTTTGYAALNASELLPLMPQDKIDVDEQLTTSERLAVDVNLAYMETADVHPADASVIDAMATLMIQRSDISVEILNDDRTVDGNETMRRTQAVRELLVRRGVDPRRVQGFGESRMDQSSPRQSGAEKRTTFVFTKM